MILGGTVPVAGRDADGVGLREKVDEAQERNARLVLVGHEVIWRRRAQSLE